MKSDASNMGKKKLKSVCGVYGKITQEKQFIWKRVDINKVYIKENNKEYIKKEKT